MSKQYTPIAEGAGFTGGSQRVYRFENGYGASVISGPYTYGGEQGLFELAVVRYTGQEFELAYDTPITEDVLGHLTESEVNEVLGRIEALPTSATTH